MRNDEIKVRLTRSKMQLEYEQREWLSGYGYTLTEYGILVICVTHQIRRNPPPPDQVQGREGQADHYLSYL